MSRSTVTEQAMSASADRLFSVLVDPVTYPRWLVGTKHIREVSADWPATDSYFKHTVGFGPIAIADRTTVLAAEGSRLLVLFVRARPVIEATVRFDVTSIGDTCRLRMSETPAGIYQLIAPLTEPLIRARNEKSMRRLKALVETDTRR